MNTQSPSKLIDFVSRKPNAKSIPSRRWRVAQPDGRVFEVDTWPFMTEAEISAACPESRVEALEEPVMGEPKTEYRGIVLSACRAWVASASEMEDALAEVTNNPLLMAGWRRDAADLNLLTDESMPDDRITCRECRRLGSGGYCGAGNWGSRYRPNPDIKQRCVAFVPMPGSSDKRTGLQRWPSLRLGE